MLIRSMKKRMEQVLQKNAEMGHVSNMEQLEQPKKDLEEAMTFHSGVPKKLEDVIENIESKIIQPIGNHPLKLWCMKTKPNTPWESMWDLTKKVKISTMRSLRQVHTLKRTKLIDSKDELMNCVGFPRK